MTALGAWLRQRMPVTLFGPVVGGLTGVAFWAAPAPRGPGAVVAAALLLALLITRYRLWDDLEDRGRDRRRHPDRAILRYPPEPFVGAVVGTAIVTLVLTAWVWPPALLLLTCLDAVFLMVYRFRGHLTDTAWRYVVLPVKYPAFVFIAVVGMGSGSGPRTAAGATIVYLSAIVYEALHTSRYLVRSRT